MPSLGQSALSSMSRPRRSRWRRIEGLTQHPEDGCRRNISMTRRAPNCSSRSRVLPEYYPTRTELGILRERGRRDRRDHSEGRGAGGIRRRRDHQGAAAAGAAVRSPPMCRSISPANSSKRRPTRCARISRTLAVHPVTADFTAPFDAARRRPRHAEGRLLPGLDARQFRAARGLAPSCAAPARSSATAR